MTPTQIVKSGEIELAVYVWGKASAGRPTVVLVHGYPDTASVWKAAANLLASHHHVVAYDVRGAGRSSRPQHSDAYDLDHLMNDLAAVVDAVSPNKPIHLVCHDWGSIACWEAVTTARMAGHIASFTSISGPSLDHTGYWLLHRLKSGSPAKMAEVARQIAHSWYMAVFHLPVLPVAAWKLGLGKLWPMFLEKMEGISNVETSPTQTADGLKGMNLYRANLLRRLLHPQERHTKLPVQLIIPRRDKFMVAEIWDDLPQWVPRLWRREVDAGHWVQVSHPQLVAELAAEFIAYIEGGEQTPALQAARINAVSAQALAA